MGNATMEEDRMMESRGKLEWKQGGHRERRGSTTNEAAAMNTLKPLIEVISLYTISDNPISHFSDQHVPRISI